MQAADGFTLTQDVAEGRAAGFWRGIIRTNCFYILSAALMIYGCYRLMDGQVISGNQFMRTLNSLMLLQGYELLVILTSIAIVRMFTRLGDAFTLFVIELVLLLDATFFANNFHSMTRGDDPTVLGVYTNIACFLLVPVKLLLLRRFLHIRLTTQAFLFFMGVATFVYLLTWPLVRRDLPVTYEEYYHVLLWLVPLLAMIVPRAEEAISGDGESGRRLTRAQRAWLPRLFLAIPTGILLAHLVETVWVHELNLHGASFAALPLAAIVAILRLPSDTADPRARILAIDALALAAIILSLPSVQYILIGVRNDHSHFLSSAFPLLITSVLVGHVYLYAWSRFGLWTALLRYGLILGSLGVYLLADSGLLALGPRMQIRSGMELLAYVIGHFRFLALLGWFAFLPFWIQRRGPLFAAVGGIYTILLATAFVGNSWESYKPEILQGALLYALVCLHVYAPVATQPGRRLFACLILVLSIGRVITEGSDWSVWVVGVQTTALVIAGLILWDRVYIALGMAVMLAALGWKVSFAVGGIPSEYRPVIAGLALFVVGIGYTVAKEKVACLRRFVDPAGGNGGRLA